MLLAHRDQPAGPVEDLAAAVVLVPVVPGDLVVLTPRVVVAPLRSAALVAAEQHRGALREQQGGDEVALLAPAKCVDLRVVGRPLGTAVPRAVVIRAIAAIFEVRLVVL